MAAPAPAIGHATITGATIYYINDVPATWADLKSELTVLEGFVTAWNADKPDDHSRLPSSTKSPPPLAHLVVNAKNHQSTYTPLEPDHISVYVFDGAQFALNPKEYGAVVHVYAKNQDPTQGYDNFFIHSAKKQKLSSAAYQAKLAAAQANNLGTLGQGRLA